MARVLIAAMHYPVASGRFMQRAFQRLGHEVKTIGEYTGDNIWGIQVNPKYNWLPDWEVSENKINRSPGYAPSEWQPDICITADCGFTLFDAPPPHVVFGVDNHVRPYEFPGVTFDHYFMTHSWGMNMDRPNATWLPAGYDTEAHTNLGIERPIDVGFIGVAYENRIKVVNALEASGINILAATGLIWDEYNAAMNQCKIALVQSIHGDLAERFFENMAQGCCVLADPMVDAEKLGFVPGVDYWPYIDANDAVQEAKYLLETGKWREIAANGQAKVKPHSWDARCKVLLETMGVK